MAASWGAGLIVVGTHGRRGIGRFVLGSDAEQILRTAPVPVLLVKEPPSAKPCASAEQAFAPPEPPCVRAGTTVSSASRRD